MDFGFGTEVLPHPRKAKFERVLRPQLRGGASKTEEKNCFGAAQLTVEADERPDVWPAGRAG